MHDEEFDQEYRLGLGTVSYRNFEEVRQRVGDMWPPDLFIKMYGLGNEVFSQDTGGELWLSDGKEDEVVSIDDVFTGEGFEDMELVEKFRWIASGKDDFEAFVNFPIFIADEPCRIERYNERLRKSASGYSYLADRLIEGYVPKGLRGSEWDETVFMKLFSTYKETVLDESGFEDIDVEEILSS